jgi:hypothetical protein
MTSQVLFDHLHGLTALRTKMMDTLTDADLAYKFPNNPSLGELCVYMGNVEQIYIGSFRTRKVVWDNLHTKAELATSVEKLKAWYKALDEEFDAVLSTIADDDFRVVYPGEPNDSSPAVDRGWAMPMGGQFRVYREALFIFYGKCTVYLRALDKPLSDQWRSWIG